MVAMMKGMIRLLFIVSSWMVIHLGRKPVSGGRPPRDMRVDVISGMSWIDLFQVRVNVRIVVFEFRLRIRNMVVVRMMYVVRYRIVIVGLYVSVIIVQPM